MLTIHYKVFQGYNSKKTNKQENKTQTPLTLPLQNLHSVGKKDNKQGYKYTNTEYGSCPFTEEMYHSPKA